MLLLRSGDLMADDLILDSDVIDEIVKRHAGTPGSLLGTLDELQSAIPGRWLPESVLRRVAERMAIPLAQLYSVVTFYPSFNLEAQGTHTIVVCRGTACHTKGSLSLLRRLARRLGFGEIVEADDAPITDGKRWITIRTVACFGQCALAPVVVVDGITYSRVTYARLGALLGDLEKDRGHED
jgi:NADH-quinone oxidoreductase subunit E